jgi:hypothetical protein
MFPDSLILIRKAGWRVLVLVDAEKDIVRICLIAFWMKFIGRFSELNELRKSWEDLNGKNQNGSPSLLPISWTPCWFTWRTINFTIHGVWLSSL